jgi:hypothetical protein
MVTGEDIVQQAEATTRVAQMAPHTKHNAHVPKQAIVSLSSFI